MYIYNQIILNITVRYFPDRPALQPLLGSDQLPREGEQAVNINTKVNEIIRSSSALPSVKTGGRQKTSPCNRLVARASLYDYVAVLLDPSRL